MCTGMSVSRDPTASSPSLGFVLEPLNPVTANVAVFDDAARLVLMLLLYLFFFNVTPFFSSATSICPSSPTELYRADASSSYL